MFLDHTQRRSTCKRMGTAIALPTSSIENIWTKFGLRVGQVYLSQKHP